MPRGYEKRYLTRLRERFLTPRGRLLVVEYRGTDSPSPLTVDQQVTALGFPVEEVRSVEDSTGAEGVRIAIVPSASSADATPHSTGR